MREGWFSDGRKEWFIKATILLVEFLWQTQQLSYEPGLTGFGVIHWTKAEGVQGKLSRLKMKKIVLTFFS